SRNSLSTSGFVFAIRASHHPMVVGNRCCGIIKASSSIARPEHRLLIPARPGAALACDGLAFRGPRSCVGVGAIFVQHTGHGGRRDEPMTALTFSGILPPVPVAKELLADVGLQTRGRPPAKKGRSALRPPRGDGRARSQ